MIWFSLVLWHTNQCRLSNAKFSLYIYIYIYIYIYQIYMIWFGWVLWHINQCGYLMQNNLYTHRLNIYDLLTCFFL